MEDNDKQPAVAFCGKEKIIHYKITAGNVFCCVFLWRGIKLHYKITACSVIGCDYHDSPESLFPSARQKRTIIDSTPSLSSESIVPPFLVISSFAIEKPSPVEELPSLTV